MGGGFGVLGRRAEGNFMVNTGRMLDIGFDELEGKEKSLEFTF